MNKLIFHLIECDFPPMGMLTINNNTSAHRTIC